MYLREGKESIALGGLIGTCFYKFSRSFAELIANSTINFV